MAAKKTIGILGFGNMGRAIGISLSGCRDLQILAYDKQKSKVSKEKGIHKSSCINDLVKKSDVVIVAVKPHDVGRVLMEAKDAFLKSKPLLVSIAAGVKINTFTKALMGIKAIRCMPNLAAIIGESMSFIAASKNCKRADIELAKQLFSCVGEVIVTKESMLDKVTAVSGSGPGYIFTFMDGLYKAALKLGFKKADAKTMVLQTFLGSVVLAYTSKDDFQGLVKKVASKKGTTEAALKVFKGKNQEKIIEQAVKSAYKRAGELAKPYRSK